MFTSVDEARFLTGTYPSFRNLLALYSPFLGTVDGVDDGEIEAFLDQLMATAPMTTALDCLVSWGISPSLLYLATNAAPHLFYP